MIRKWLKFNSCFVELLRNSIVPKSLEQKFVSDFSCRRFPSSLSLCSGSTSSSVTSISSTGNINKSFRLINLFSEPNEREDAESQQSDSEEAIAETPARTELFEIKGPDGSAFLVEVHAGDLEEVRNQLVRLKGDVFHFDKTVIDWFIMKCILAADPCKKSKSEQKRLAKIHAISSGSEEVYEGNGKFFFVNAIGRTMRARRILEKFGYNISGIMYRFQPKERIKLEDETREICSNFVRSVRSLPKVISIIHNLKSVRNVKPEPKTVKMRGKIPGEADEADFSVVRRSSTVT